MHRWRAALLMLVAVAMFALMDAGLKLLSAHYPPFQVAALRGAASLPLVLAWALATVGPKRLMRVRWPMHLLRGGLGVLMMTAFVYALRSLPLSTAYTIFFVAPLLITALSVPVLGERVGPRRWTAIVVGFIGVMVVLRPTGEGLMTLAGLAVLLLIAKGIEGGFDPVATGFASNGYGERSPMGYDLTSVLIAETVLTAVFLFVILGATAKRAAVGPTSR